ncbi:unnamed protein product [Schistosoma rodhaini]|uniref:Reverse transcriptase domain-containing protein n=1 Tax=Schistosoma rodhaini TaxID=6188 RepID=A0AA85EYW2_9TREM|nr:unnamed protein product [Schistosoma rodhaini]
MNVHLIFNNTYYRQIDGITMGSHLDTILVDFVFAKLDNGPLKEINDKHDFYFRYIDDTFIVVNQNIRKEQLLEASNNKHSAIKFTCGKELDNKLHFLEVLLNRKEKGSISRSVYRKSSLSSKYSHFLSFVPFHCKRNLLR